MGAIALASSNPNVVWLGTGEAWSARISSYGDGVYKSEDGGKTWHHMGLRETRYIGRIVVHPEDENTVYVAALGSLWGPNEERGLFKTTDGGKSWTKMLYENPHTGVVEVALDPSRPDTVYAATYLRERRAWNFVGGGPESGLFKSTDGGETWVELTNGCPKWIRVASESRFAEANPTQSTQPWKLRARREGSSAPTTVAPAGSGARESGTLGSTTGS